MKHEISPYRAFYTALQLTVFSLSVLLALLIGGCENAVENVADDAASTSDVSKWQFDSPQHFVDYVTSLDDNRQRVAMFKHMYGRTTEEQWAVQYHGAAARSEVEYRMALQDHFTSDAQSLTEEPLKLLALPAAADSVNIEPFGETRARIKFADAGGVERLVVLARIRGSWTPHATTITNGEDVQPVWCNVQRSPYEARIKFYRDVAESIRRGEYDSHEQASQTITRLLAGPPPPLGSVQPD